MSNSLARVENILKQVGIGAPVQTEQSAHTAAEAALCLRCDLAQIVKSLVFQDTECADMFLFLTSGAQRVDLEKASGLVGRELRKGDAERIRTKLGFVIGGVAPVGHLIEIRCFVDRNLSAFETVWAAAGTPYHMFSVAPDVLVNLAKGKWADFT